jgi:uncharacterized membrane protein (UPF0127 family)
MFKGQTVINVPHKHEGKSRMLFIFPYETEQSFWMKNTVLALDMLFINSNNEIVKIHHNNNSFSEQSYPSEKRLFMWLK